MKLQLAKKKKQHDETGEGEDGEEGDWMDVEEDDNFE